MAKKIVWQPEQIDENTYRVKVIGGWLVTIRQVYKSTLAISTTFIADRDWEWSVCEPFVDPKVEKSALAKEYEA